VENTEIYENRIVAVLDILGITEKIRNSVGKPKEQNELLSLYERVISSIKEAIHSTFIRHDFKVSTFSDTIVVSAGLNIKSQIAMMRAIRIIQAGLSGKHVFIRGGITVGGMYHQADIYFGKAYLDAHELECKNAIYPRVIICKKFMENIINANSMQTSAELVKKDIDGFYYVDYIGNVTELIGFNGSREIIMNNLLLHENNLKIKQKMNWVLTKISELEKQ